MLSSPKGSLAQQKRKIVLASAFFSYTHVLQDGGQYTDLYEVSRSFTKMTRKLQGVYWQEPHARLSHTMSCVI